MVWPMIGLFHELCVGLDLHTGELGEVGHQLAV